MPLGWRIVLRSISTTNGMIITALTIVVISAKRRVSEFVTILIELRGWSLLTFYPMNEKKVNII